LSKGYAGGRGRDRPGRNESAGRDEIKKVEVGGTKRT